MHYVEESNGGAVLLRPYVFEFLERVSRYYEVFVFTASLKEYADQIIDTLDPQKTIFSKRFYREDLRRVNDESFKDLSILNRDLERVIIVDNSPSNFSVQKENGIFIKSWYGEKQDKVLKELQKILVDIVESNTKDVRVYLKKVREKVMEDIK